MTKDEIIEMADRAFDESSFTDAEVIRFAELIVKRCLILADNIRDVNQRGLVDQMKQHFGVK